MESVHELIQKNESEGIEKFRTHIAKLNLNPSAESKLISMFKSAFLPSASQESEIIWEYVKPMTSEYLFSYENLQEPKNPKKLLNQLAIVKLNGGLGTTMGCTFPKSLIECNNGKSFFDLTIEQVKYLNNTYNVDIPLLLMQSFYTNDLMRPIIEKTKGVRILTYTQNKFPRIYQDTLEPVPKDETSPIGEWNPPGHGDVFHCLKDSGLLEQLLKEGKKYIFISNIDNLGATVDLKIFNKAASEQRSFLTETVPKTPDDWKGGMPILYKGRIRLLETAQVPEGHMKDFIDTKKFSVFNSNNMWVNLKKLKEILDNDKLVLDVIKNKKVYNGRNVIQLEAAAGSAIQSFSDSISIKVPRMRFLSVKSCNELLLMRSDFYIFKDGNFFINKNRKEGDFVSIKLNPLYTKVQDFESKFIGLPSIINLVSLEIDGDVTFGKGITLEGNVKFIVPKGEKWVIPDGKIYKNVTITKSEQF